jgi:hypothetical protein
MPGGVDRPSQTGLDAPGSGALPLVPGAQEAPGSSALGQGARRLGFDGQSRLGRQSPDRPRLAVRLDPLSSAGRAEGAAVRPHDDDDPRGLARRAASHVRPSVTAAAGAFQNAGIEYRRGEITVLDRQGLEAASCECYRAVKQAYARLMTAP